jgi:ATP-dependent DNA helicase RecQ
MADCTDAARLIVGCIQQLPRTSGIEIIGNILWASKNAKIREYGFDALPAYGSGKNYSQDQYRSWINDLVRQGYLSRTGDKYPVICLTGRSIGLQKGRCRVLLPALQKGGATKTPAPQDATLRENDQALFQCLKSLRKSLADLQGVPPYVIFSDKSLRGMATTRPCDPERFATIPGVGEFKLATYGPVFIEEIRKKISGFPV